MLLIERYCCLPACVLKMDHSIHLYPNCACWNVLYSMAIWKHSSKHRLHHFLIQWPGRLEFIIICAVVQGNKGALLFRKSPFTCFVLHLHLRQVPLGEDGALKDDSFCGWATSKHMCEQYRQSTQTWSGSEPGDDVTSDTIITQRCSFLCCIQVPRKQPGCFTLIVHLCNVFSWHI